MSIAASPGTLSGVRWTNSPARTKNRRWKSNRMSMRYGYSALSI
jgi:hypothetical protein